MQSGKSEEKSTQPSEIDIFDGKFRDTILGLAKGISKEARDALKQASEEGSISKYIHAVNEIWNQCSSTTNMPQCSLKNLATLEHLVARVNLVSHYFSIESQKKAHPEELFSQTFEQQKKLKDANMSSAALSDTEARLLTERISNAKKVAIQKLKNFIQAEKEKSSPQTKELRWISELVAEVSMLEDENADFNKLWDTVSVSPAEQNKASPARLKAHQLLKRYADQYIAYDTYKINCQTVLPSGSSLTICWGNGHEEYPDMQDAWVSGTLPTHDILSDREIQHVMMGWVEKLQQGVLAKADAEDKSSDEKNCSLREGGATFVASLVCRDKIHTVNLADSLAYVCMVKKDGQVKLQKLNEYEHVASNKQEQERILLKALRLIFTNLSIEKLKEMIPVIQETGRKYNKLKEENFAIPHVPANSAAKYAISKEQEELLKGGKGLGAILCHMAGLTYSVEFDKKMQSIINLEDMFQATKKDPSGKRYPAPTLKGSQVTGGITADMVKLELGHQTEAAYSVHSRKDLGVTDGDRVFLLHMTDGVLKKINFLTLNEDEVSHQEVEENIKKAVRAHVSAANAAAAIGKELTLGAFNAGSGDNICSLVSEITLADDSQALHYQGVIDGNGKMAGNRVAYLVADHADLELKNSLNEVVKKTKADVYEKDVPSFLFTTKKGKKVALPEVDSEHLTHIEVDKLISDYIAAYKNSSKTLNVDRAQEAANIVGSTRWSPKEKLIHLLANDIALVRKESRLSKLHIYKYGEFHHAILSKWPELTDAVIAQYNQGKEDGKKISPTDDLHVEAVKTWRKAHGDHTTSKHGHK